MTAEERIADEKSKAEKALNENNTTLALVHLYAAMMLSENNANDQQPNPKEQPSDSTHVNEASVKLKIRNMEATMIYQPVKGDERYRFKTGDGSRYTLVKNSNTVGAIGHNYSCKLKRNSYYFRSAQVPLFLHHVFGVEKTDPDYAHCSLIIARAMKTAETVFMNNSLKDDKGDKIS